MSKHLKSIEKGLRKLGTTSLICSIKRIETRKSYMLRKKTHTHTHTQSEYSNDHYTQLIELVETVTTTYLVGIDSYNA